MHTYRRYRFLLSRTLKTSLVIFALLFGAGNLIFPLKVGLLSGDKSFWGLLGFIFTGVLLPLIGLLAVVSFDGNYRAFFDRVGKRAGSLLVFFCMLAIGPLIVMPRVVALSYEMLSPFLPNISIAVFTIIFLTLAFFAVYRPRKLMSVIGNVLSPLKITSLIFIISFGLFTGFSTGFIKIGAPRISLFMLGSYYGYGTLDLLVTIFFGAILIKMLGFESGEAGKIPMRDRVCIATVGAIGGATLLGLVYVGMGLLGAFHGQGLEALNEGQLFSAISFRILGSYGAVLIAATVFLACFTTFVAISAVIVDYIRGLSIGSFIVKEKLSYTYILIAVLGVTFIPATLGLSAIVNFSMPLIEALYPLVIAVVFCNVFYKIFGMRTIKIPVFLTLCYVVLRFFY